MNNKERTVNIENFIGIYDNWIPEVMCKNAIKLFENESKLKNTLNRVAGENSSILDKKDQQYFAQGENIDVFQTAHFVQFFCACFSLIP